MSYPAYTEYKDSGVEWLGEVPAHWGVSPFKWQIEANDGGAWGVDPTGENDTYVLRSTDQTVDGHWKITEPALRHLSINERFATVLKAGDLVITKSSGSSLHIGKTTIVDDLMTLKGFSFGNFMQRIRTKNSFSSRLAWYFMNNRVARLQLDLLSNSTTGLANLNGTILGEILAATPPREEQADIVTFLEHETARIDALVEEQKRLIALLKEKRQAVISHAVTKGLDPDVPMKDSGVEWLGEVPQHWTVGKVKHLAVISGGYAFNSNEFSDSGIQLIRIGNLYQSKLQLDREPIYVPIASRGKYKPFEVKWGDLLMSLTGTLGKRDYGFAVMYDSVDPSLLNQRVAKITPLSEKVEPAFLLLLLQSESYLNQIYSLPSGTKQANLSNSDVLSPWIASPSCLQEQSAIVNRVSVLTSRLDQLINKSGVAISLLQERRSALISAAVTGKIDVRGWKPPAESVVSTKAKQMEAV